MDKRSEAAPSRRRQGLFRTLQFGLPVRIADEHRANLKEMYLYVKGPLSNDWIKQETVPPSATKFSCRVPTDGEYWFPS